jgi:uncharacterized membrane protein YvbJ
MKYCTHCGAEVADAAVVCVKCGCPIENIPGQIGAGNDDTPSAGYAVLGFFVPLVGSILILVWGKSKPRRAVSCAKGVAINVIVSAVFSIIFSFLWITVFSSFMQEFLESFM